MKQKAIAEGIASDEVEAIVESTAEGLTSDEAEAIAEAIALIKNPRTIKTTDEKRARELANEARAAIMMAKEDPIKQSPKEVSRLERIANKAVEKAEALEAEAFAEEIERQQQEQQQRKK